MEKTLNNLINLANLPSEIKREIATHLTLSELGFFAMTHKQALISILPLLRKFLLMRSKLTLCFGANCSLYYIQGGQLFVCGLNDFNELGLGHTKMQLDLVAIPWLKEQGEILQVVVGWGHTFLITKDNKLWACGYNKNGQLGLGNTDPSTIFTNVNLPGKLKQVFTLSTHTFILTDDDRLWACGDNSAGQLGLGHLSDCHIFTQVPLPEKPKQVVAELEYSLIVTTDGRLWACGGNDFGQLCMGHNNNCHTLTQVPLPVKVKQVFAKLYSTFVLTEEGQLWACGENGDSQLGLGDMNDCYFFKPVPLPHKVKEVIVGSNYNFLIDEDDKLWACGENKAGQLGLGHVNNCNIFTPVPLPNKVKQVIVDSFTLVVMEDFQLWGCGDTSFFSEFGLKKPTHTFSPVQKIPTIIWQDIQLNQMLYRLYEFAKGLNKSGEILQAPKNLTSTLA